MDFSSLSMVAISNSPAISSSSLLDLDLDSSICISPPHDLPSLNHSLRKLNCISPPHDLAYVNYSLRKQHLNAEAPAFVPRSASSPSLTTLPAAANAKPASHKLKPSASSSTLAAPQHAAKTLLHVYATPGAGGTTYHQITTHVHVPVPVQPNYVYTPQQQPLQYHRPLLRSTSGGFFDKAKGQEVAVGTTVPVRAASPPPSSDSDQGWKKLSDEACNKIVNQVNKIPLLCLCWSFWSTEHHSSVLRLIQLSFQCVSRIMQIFLETYHTTYSLTFCNKKKGLKEDILQPYPSFASPTFNLILVLQPPYKHQPRFFSENPSFAWLLYIFCFF